MTTMASLLDRKLLLVTGKGGTGKTTISAALGLLAARRGLRTLVAEIGDQHRLAQLFGHTDTPGAGAEIELQAGLWSTSIDPDHALFEWLQVLSGRITARMLAASSSFQYFAAAAPGARELVTMAKVRQLCERDGRRKPYDLVVLDAPATGHALALLRSPQTFAAIVRVGPLAEQARQVRELLEDPSRSGYLAIAQGTEMAVTETLELEEGLRRTIDRDLDAVIVNGTVPRRFTREELARILAAAEAIDAADVSPAGATARAAAHTARVIHERARVQQSQIARLRRQRFAGGRPPGVLTVPFAFTPELDLAAIREIANQLDRKL